MKNVYIFVMDITKTGGTERTTLNLYEMLKGNGVNVQIISLAGEDGTLRYGNPDIVYWKLPILGTGFLSKLIWFFSFCKRIIAYHFVDNAFFVGTGHNINVLLSLYKFRRKDIKVVLCEHIQLNSIPRISRKIMGLAYKYSDAIVMLSQSAKTAFIQNYPFLSGQIYVIPNALPFSPQENNLMREKRIIMVGRLSAEKGYERVIPIAKYLQLNHPQWRIDIFGDGVLKKELVDLFYQNGLFNTCIKGVTNDVMSEYMKSSMLIMTSYTEAMPMVILEANACWLPVIAYECEGTNELIKDGVNGFIISNENIADFNKKIDMLINDDLKRESMAISSRELSQKYSRDKVVVVWMSLFDKILGYVQK